MSDSQINSFITAIFWFVVIVVLGVKSFKDSVAGEPASWGIFLFMPVALCGLALSIYYFCREIKHETEFCQCDKDTGISIDGSGKMECLRCMKEKETLSEDNL